MLVGEAPGAEEDRQGLPFVGRSGALLTRLLAEAGLPREQVFIANTLKCRPPDNRNPRTGEIEACRPWLAEQIRLIEPRVVATLGNFANRLLSGDETGITKVHGVPRARTFGARTVWLYPLFHPAAALRATGTADLLRRDIEALPELLARDLPQGPAPGGPA
jgi:DNA polymerase